MPSVVSRISTPAAPPPRPRAEAAPRLAWPARGAPVGGRRRCGCQRGVGGGQGGARGGGGPLVPGGGGGGSGGGGGGAPPAPDVPEPCPRASVAKLARRCAGDRCGSLARLPHPS